MGEFDGKRVVVCGGSRGIGRSVALGFAEAGAAVSVCARSTGPRATTRSAIAATGCLAPATAPSSTRSDERHDAFLPVANRRHLSQASDAKRFDIFIAPMKRRFSCNRQEGSKTLLAPCNRTPGRPAPRG